MKDIQEAVTQLLAWATTDEGKRFRKKIWDRKKLKWLSFTGKRPTFTGCGRPGQQPPRPQPRRPAG